MQPYDNNLLSKMDYDNGSILNTSKKQSNRLLDAYAQVNNLTSKIKSKYVQSDIQTSKILSQEKDILLLSKN